jgi:hypothetical protein
MIWSLMREQLRSQRRYVAWSAAMIALAVAVITYGALFTTTASDSARALDHAMGYDNEWYSLVTLEPTDFDGAMSLAELDALLDEATDAGANPIANRPVYADMPAGSALYAYGVTAVRGAVGWDTLLVEGEPPRAGEVAVSASWAADMGLTIGDHVSLIGFTNDQPNGIELAISALAVSSFQHATAASSVPVAYVAWEDVDAINAASASTSPSDLSSDVMVTWTGAADQFSPARGELLHYEEVSSNSVLLWSFAFTGALIVGLTAMAFAVGRTQAQARVKWVATARALGATRKHLAAAAALEASAVGLGAGIAGYVLGTLAVNAHLWLIHSDVLGAAIATSAALSPLVFAGAILFALLLAAIVGAVPAFWSLRAQPVEALKPGNDLTEATVSRRVGVKSLLIAWVAANVAVAVVHLTDGVYTWLPILVVAWLIIVIVGVALLVELLRRVLARMGRRLSATSNVRTLVAGDQLTGQPRLAAIPAFITALTTAVVITAVISTAIGTFVTYGGDSYMGQIPDYTDENSFMIAVVIGAVLLSTLVCVAIVAASVGVTGRDDSARTALGARPSDVRHATAFAYRIHQATGLWVGVLVALYMSAWLAVLTVRWSIDNAPDYPATVVSPLDAIAYATMPVVVAIGMCAIGILLGSIAAYASVPARMPADQLMSSA